MKDFRVLDATFEYINVGIYLYMPWTAYIMAHIYVDDLMWQLTASRVYNKAGFFWFPFVSIFWICLVIDLTIHYITVLVQWAETLTPSVCSVYQGVSRYGMRSTGPAHPVVQSCDSLLTSIVHRGWRSKWEKHGRNKGKGSPNRNTLMCSPISYCN